MLQRRHFALAVLALGTALGASAQATGPAPAGRLAIVDTAPPGGFLGYWGFDVFTGQSVAARFVVPDGADHRLLRIGLWLMNNAESQQRALRLSLQTDALDEGGSETLPSGRTLATWTGRVEALGWNPVQQFFGAAKGGFPVLKAGRHYWVVAESQAPALFNPVWTVASEGTMVTTTTANGAWQTAGEGASLTLRVDAVPVAAH